MSCMIISHCIQWMSLTDIPIKPRFHIGKKFVMHEFATHMLTKTIPIFKFSGKGGIIPGPPHLYKTLQSSMDINYLMEKQVCPAKTLIQNDAHSVFSHVSPYLYTAKQDLQRHGPSWYLQCISS